MNFEDKSFRPMLIAKEEPPFDNPDYLYEIKLDGVRCLAYLDETETFLQNKRGVKLHPRFPECKKLHKQVKKRCILDGELYVFHNGVNDFFEVQRRTLTSDPFKISRLSKQKPATFTAFDILWLEDEDITNLPLIKRKALLQKNVKENSFINVSRTIAEHGIALYNLTEEQGFEGIVAKRNQSIYVPDKRTKDWIKCKHMLDDDFVVVGYIVKSQGIISLILGQYHEKKLLYKGHVTMGASLPYLRAHTSKTSHVPFQPLPKGNEEAIWITPHLVGTVKFMEYMETGGLRQPVFKGFREDKQPNECKVALANIKDS